MVVLMENMIYGHCQFVNVHTYPRYIKNAVIICESIECTIVACKISWHPIRC